MASNDSTASPIASALLLAPLAPHLAEKLWQRLGNTESLAYHAWPVADTVYLKADVRGRIVNFVVG